MSPQSLIDRLESAYRHLNEEGWYVHANTIALAIEALSLRTDEKAVKHRLYMREYRRGLRRREGKKE